MLFNYIMDWVGISVILLAFAFPLWLQYDCRIFKHHVPKSLHSIAEIKEDVAPVREENFCQKYPEDSSKYIYYMTKEEHMPNPKQMR